MSEGTTLLKIIGLIITVAVWGYCNFSKDPEIVKNRSVTQKWVNTGVALFVICLIIIGFE
jgi:uncharacterized membrane protein YidH (DUF202 family)